MSEPRKTIPPELRFWPKVDKAGPVIRPELGPCWIWTGAKDKDGYGLFQLSSVVTRRAHRLTLAWHLGRTLTPDEHSLHACDNPPCVNPAHLSVGTEADNAIDRETRGRHPHTRSLESARRASETMRRKFADGAQTWKMRLTHCKRGHEFTPENTMRHKDTPRARHCRTCAAARQRERRQAA